MPAPRRLLPLLLCLLVAACSFQETHQPPGATASPIPSSSPDAGEASGASLSPFPVTPTSLHPSPTPPPARATRYRLAATLDYARHRLEVEQEIDYMNRAAQALDDLLLVVEPAYYPGTFELKSLAWEEGQTVEGAAWKGTHLRLPLREPLAPGAALRLSLSYTLNLPSPTPSPTTRPVPFGYTQRQTNLVDWYPFIPPYQGGQGWLAHDPGFFGEHLAYEASDFEVEIRLAEPSYAGAPLVIAASAPVEQQGEVYRYQMSAARNFAWSVSHQYQVRSTVVGPVTVLSYAFPIHPTAGQAVLQTTAQALELYNRLFGSYQRETLSVVEADFLDGMEYDGLYFLSNGFYNLYQGTPGEYLVTIAAHETAHQWWYGLVGNDQALEPWLDEALCTYSERLYFENLYPESLEWWWAYRVNYYQPGGWVDGSIYNPGGFRPYRDAVYLNGAVFLEALRGQVGEAAFFATLKDYAARYAHRIATGADFFAVLSEHSPQDIDALLQTYFQKDPRQSGQ